MRLTKNQRQHRIARLLAARPVGSQAQLVELLAAEGVEATQTTVSRDLEELGALKVRLPGGDTAYALPELPVQQIAPSDHLRRVLGEWAVEITSSGNLVMLRTPPGCAHVVASAMDRSGLDGVLGTVAGDDTVLVVVAEDHRGHEMAARLEALAGLAEAGPGHPADPRDGAGLDAGEAAAGPDAQSVPTSRPPRTTAPRRGAPPVPATASMMTASAVPGTEEE